MSLPKSITTEKPINEVSATASAVLIILAFFGSGIQWFDTLTFAPPAPHSVRAETVEQMYLKDNKCWFINTFEGNKGQTRYAYYCERHPKNPAFADEYVARFDPQKKESNLTEKEVNALYSTMYRDGVTWGYITPKPRNEEDKKLLATHTAAKQKAELKKKQEEAAREAELAKQEALQEEQTQKIASQIFDEATQEEPKKEKTVNSTENDITFSEPIIID